MTLTEQQDLQFNLFAAGRPKPFSLREELYPGARDYWELSTSKRAGDPLTGVTAIVVHATSGSGCEAAMSAMKARMASWHWLVPRKDERQHGAFVWACALETRAAWHVQKDLRHPEIEGGQVKVKHCSLAIQVANHGEQDGVVEFTPWQVSAVARIIRYCWAKYPNLSKVVSHARIEPSRAGHSGAAFPWRHLRELVIDSSEDDVPALVSSATPVSLLPRAKNLDAVCGHAAEPRTPAGVL